MMLEFLRDKAITEANPFKTAKIKRIHFLPFMGLKENDYGGRVKTVAELQEGGLFLIVDKDCNTIDVARIKDEELPEETPYELRGESPIKIMVCKKCGLEFEGKGKFLTHSRNCK